MSDSSEKMNVCDKSIWPWYPRLSRLRRVGDDSTARLNTGRLLLVRLLPARVVSSTNYSLKIRAFYFFSDVVVCQSVVRRCMAAAQVSNMRHERSMAAATKIQAMWRCFHSMNVYFEAVMDIVVVQSVVRRLLSMRLFAQLREEKRLLETVAAVKIASMWRGFVCLREYKQSVRGMSVVKIYPFYNECACFILIFRLLLSDIVVCQSAVRRNKAASQVARLRHDQRTDSAIIIQATWRARIASDAYILTLYDIVTLQSLARRLVAQRILGQLREEKYLVKVSAATTIASSWRRFDCLKKYRRTIAGMPVRP